MKNFLHRYKLIFIFMFEYLYSGYPGKSGLTKKIPVGFDGDS